MYVVAVSMLHSPKKKKEKKKKKTEKRKELRDRKEDMQLTCYACSCVGVYGCASVCIHIYKIP